MSSTLYLFLLFTVLVSHRGATTEDAVEPVKDLNGQPLQTGISYYILPVIRSRGGGLAMSKTESQTCPNSVIQEPFEVSRSMPVTFSPFDKSNIIHVSTDLNFKFSPSSIWRLDNDEAKNLYFISTCGVEGNPGQTTISNWFKIDEYEGDYKIRFCPTVCDFCRVMCRDIGVMEQDGKIRLVLSAVPFKVIFKKA